ncbi:MAG: hypothetical protein O0W99_09170, partial [Methanocorpusculum sp.]|nr:hypothetical protein [Methanocorpusculum sp.]
MRFVEGAKRPRFALIAFFILILPDSPLTRLQFSENTHVPEKSTKSFRGITTFLSNNILRFSAGSGNRCNAGITQTLIC